MLKDNKLSVQKILFPLFGVLTVAFLVGIVLININSEAWYNFDIYADAMYGKYAAEAKSLFPDAWSFGNQFYVSATPSLSALIYLICSDIVVSLETASCIMTLLILLTFVWCIYPYVSKKSLIVGLCCIIGGTLLGTSAAVDRSSLQVFFTMASYYSCYLICILLTLGIWLRLYYKQKVNLFLIVICFVFNLSLGMQSLREMLVLNLPLCAVSFFLVFLNKRPWKPLWLSKSNIFAVAMFIANFSGLILINILKDKLHINQTDILVNANSDIINNLISSVKNLASFIGFHNPDFSLFSTFKTISATILLGVVVYTVVDILINYIKTRTVKPLYCLILFCAVSLCAVLCAGILVIETRNIYYFVWHLLVALSFVYVTENIGKRIKLHTTVLVFVLVIGILNFWFNFSFDYKKYVQYEPLYTEMTDTLLDDGVTHVYYDEDHIFSYGTRIAAFSDDKIIAAAFNKNLEKDDVITPIKYLCSDEWYSMEHISSSYVMLTSESLQEIEDAGLSEYFSANAQLKRHFVYRELDLYFYSFSEELFYDLISS